MKQKKHPQYFSTEPINIMEGTNIYISDTDDQKMRKVLSSISSVIFREKKYDEILLKTIPI